MTVLGIDAQSGLAVCVDERGARRANIEVELVEPVACGELLLVHAGTAIARAERGAA
ncbi:MAG TPA: HypC/HybG/HupF family hydrogenase formation chaperone [Solirubrobacteraceae bacterium]|jgi:hydrogenase maturation factor